MDFKTMNAVSLMHLGVMVFEIFNTSFEIVKRVEKPTNEILEGKTFSTKLFILTKNSANYIYLQILK